MKELTELLSKLDADSSVGTIESIFSRIAEILLLKSYIQTTDGNFRLLEIEFYFYNKYHKDIVTMSRTEKAGMWWLHNWGVDISFNSKQEGDFYGGILIRSIVELNSENVISGPQNCCWQLFYSSALENNMAPKIILNDEGKAFEGEIGRTKRYITGKTKGIDADYRFFVKGIKLNIDSKYKASPWK